MDKTFIYVYQTVCEANGKIYVGVHKTDNIDDGYIGCGILSQGNARRSSVFHNAVRKYGYASFKRHILSFHETYEDALIEERRIVNKDWVVSKSNYNTAIGGKPNIWSWCDRDEMILKIRNAAKLRVGIKLSPNHIDALKKSNSRYWSGKKRSDETKMKQSVSCTGRKITDLVREKLSVAKKGKPSNRAKVVFKVDLYGSILGEYRSIADAAVNCGMKRSTVHLWIQKRYNKNGVSFKYKEAA